VSALVCSPAPLAATAGSDSGRGTSARGADVTVGVRACRPVERADPPESRRRFSGVLADFDQE